MRTQGFFKNLIVGSKRWKWIFKDSSQITPLIWWFSKQPSWWELFLTSDISCLYHSYALGVYCPVAIISLVWSPTGGQITWGEKSHLKCSVCTELRKVQSTSDQMSTEFLGNLCPSLKQTKQITPGLTQAFSITPSAPSLWPSSLIYYYVSSPSASCPKTKVRILNPDPVVPAVAHHADSSFRT